MVSICDAEQTIKIGLDILSWFKNAMLIDCLSLHKGFYARVSQTNLNIMMYFMGY